MKVKSNNLTANLIHRPGAAVKAAKADTGWVEGYLVSWGNEQDTDLQGEHFSPRTEFCLDWFKERPVLYHHGLDNQTGLRKVGTIKSVEPDELGLWVQAQLDLRDQYARAVYDMVKTKEFGWSSGSVDHLVQIADNGEIACWPLIEGSITPTPAQPSKTSVRAFKAILSSDKTIQNYLRELDARVDNETKSDALKSNYSRRKSGLIMPKTSSQRLTRAFADAFGLKADSDEINQIAAQMDAEVQNEIVNVAADEMEYEAEMAALEALEEELTQEGIRTMRRTKRYTPRRSAYRSELPVIDGAVASELEQAVAAEMEEIAAEMADEMAVQMAEEMAEEMAPIMAEELASQTGEVAPIQAARAVRRSGKKLMRRMKNELGVTTDPLAVESDEELLQPAKRYRRSLSRARRNFGEEALPVAGDEVYSEDEVAAMMEEVAAASYRNGRRSVMKQDTLLDETAVLTDVEEIAAQAELEEAKRYVRKGYNAGRRARRNFGEEALPVAGDEAYMTEDELAVQSEEALMTEEFPTRRYSRKSADGNYWRNRAMKAENMEAAGQRSFGNVRVTRDAGDQPGAYENAFKSYLQVGLGLMNDSEKQVLRGRGQVAWGGGSFGLGSDGRVKSLSAKAYFGGSDASVGFAVPPDWVNELNKNIMTQTVMAAECKMRTTTSDRIVQPTLVTTDARRAHAAKVRWPDEVITDDTESRTIEDQYAQTDVPIHVMLISLTAGNSALEDVTFSLEDEINEAFSEAVAVAYDELIWGGDGQAKLEGIVTNNRVIGSRSAGVTTVGGYVPTGSPNGIVTADVLKEMLFHLPRGYRARAKWYMNSDTGLQIATLKDGEGNYLIDQRDESLQAVGVPDRLLGRPIVYNEYADSVETNQYPIILGDLSKGYLIGKRVDFSIRRFDDAKYAEKDQVLFLGRARLGGQVIQPAAIKVLKVSAS